MSYSLGDFVKVDRKTFKMGTITRIYENSNVYQVMCAQSMKFYTVAFSEIKETVCGKNLDKLVKSKSLFFPPPSAYHGAAQKKKRKK